MESPLRFHWSPHATEVPKSIPAFMEFCREVQSAGMESVAVEGDALLLVPAAIADGIDIRFRISCGDGSSVENLAHRLGSAIEAPCRLILHWRADGSAQGESPQDRSLTVAARKSVVEFRAGWLLPDAQIPEVHVEGDSADAAFFAIQHADCLWRHPHLPNQVHADALPVLHFGKEVGLVTSLIARATREEAFEAARSLLPADSPHRVGSRFLLDQSPSLDRRLSCPRPGRR